MSLEAFLNNFNSADGKYIYTIDPLKTFDVSIAFDYGVEGKDSNGDKTTDGVKSDMERTSLLRQAGINFLNNITGGIWGKLGSKDVKNTGYESLMPLIKDSLFKDGEGMELHLKYFVQEATLPSISIPNDAMAETSIGNIQTHKMALETDSKEFSLRILNTKVSLLDRIFYPWMREVSYPYWSYSTHPYTTATITIDMTEHNDISYVFLGCRPTKIESLNPTNQLDTNMSRSVTFTFDFMYIKSQCKNIDGWVDSLVNTGISIVNKAASTIGL